MTDFSHDWIGTVGRALPETTGVNMDIGNNNTPGLPTMRPEIAEPATIDSDSTGVQRVWIDIVVIDELLDPPLIAHAAQ